MLPAEMHSGNVEEPGLWYFFFLLFIRFHANLYTFFSKKKIRGASVYLLASVTNNVCNKKINHMKANILENKDSEMLMHYFLYVCML